MTECGSRSLCSIGSHGTFAATSRIPYEMHRTLMTGFAKRPKGEAERVRFRLDEHQTTRELSTLVQSASEPDWAPLTERRYVLAPPQIKELEPKLTKGQRLAFRLRANPTVKREGKRLGLLREEEQRTWLERKAGMGGFRLVECVVISESTVRCARTGGTTMSWASVRFEGHLVVEEPASFVCALEKGIGSGKAFGFGLLSVARP